MAVTLVIPFHGEARHLQRLLDRLEQQADHVHGRLPVVVSDDASPEPASMAAIADRYPSLDLVVVRSETNGGPGAARNRALERVRTPWVAFLDADMVPGGAWRSRLARLTEGLDGPAGYEGPVSSGDDAVTPLTHTTVVRWSGDRHIGGNVVYRTAVLRSVGGWDEQYFDPGRRIHFREDAALWFRLRDAGHEIGFDPDLVAQHPPLPASFRSSVRLARRYYFDPLLRRDFPDQYRAMNRAHRIGGLSARRLRHIAAMLVAVGFVTVVVGVVGGWPTIARAGAAGLVAGWLATGVALVIGRRLPARELVPVVALAAVVPWVYLWHYYRGVLDARRHRSTRA